MEFTVRKLIQIIDNKEIPCITPFTICVSEPHGNEPDNLTKEDVFGKVNLDTWQQESKGMVVASSGEYCPIWGDIVPFKSSTILCPNEDLLDAVIYWCEHVDGRDSVTRIKRFLNGKVAIRTDYQCW